MLIKNGPKLSVIIPVYNAQEYIEQCLNSILNQSFRDYEIILVNDGSTDSSGEICDEYAQKFSMIRVLHTKNSGVSAARNYGIEYANGEYIHFMDSDDTIESNMYQEFNEKATIFPYDLIISGRRNCNLVNNSVNNFQFKNDLSAQNREEVAGFLLEIEIKDKNWVMNVIWNKWFKRSVLMKYNIKFRSDICPGEDFIFVSDMFKKINTLFILGKSYYNYYIRGEDSLLGKFYEDVLVRRPIIYTAHKDIYVSYNIYDQYKDKINFYEGRRVYEELYSIFKKNCNLSIPEKLSHVDNIIHSEHFKYAIQYLSNSKKQIDKRIAYMLLKSKNTYLTISFTYVFFLLKRRRNLGFSKK